MVGLHDLPAVQLVPKNTIIEIRGIFHHVGGIFLPGENGVLVDVPLVGNPLSHHPVKIRDDQVALVVFRCPDQREGGLRRDPVIAVQKLEVGAPGLGKGQVPGVGHAGVFLVEHPDPLVPGGVAVTQAAGGVRAAVIDQQQLVILIRLVQNAVHTAGQGLFRVVYGNDDTDNRMHGGLLFSWTLGTGGTCGEKGVQGFGNVPGKDLVAVL